MDSGELKHRRPVWQCLTQVLAGSIMSEAEWAEIAACLAVSPYDITELNNILVWEVYPACIPFRGSMPFPWDRADPTLLERRIMRGPSFLAWLETALFGRISVGLSPTWSHTKRLVMETRERGRPTTG